MGKSPKLARGAGGRWERGAAKKIVAAVVRLLLTDGYVEFTIGNDGGGVQEVLAGTLEGPCQGSAGDRSELNRVSDAGVLDGAIARTPGGIAQDAVTCAVVIGVGPGGIGFQWCGVGGDQGNFQQGRKVEGIGMGDYVDSAGIAGRIDGDVLTEVDINAIDGGRDGVGSRGTAGFFTGDQGEKRDDKQGQTILHVAEFQAINANRLEKLLGFNTLFFQVDLTGIAPV